MEKRSTGRAVLEASSGREATALRTLSSARIAAFIEAETAVYPVARCPEIKIHAANSMAGIWERADECLGVSASQPPYWSVAWVGGQALARYLLDNSASIAGRRALDVGTGSGLCAIAAALAGATVDACEIDPIARVACGLNIALNHVQVAVLEEDLLSDDPPQEYDLILAADLWYEKRIAEPVTAWLRRAVRTGTEVLLGDRGRAFFPRAGMIRLAEYPVLSSPEVEQASITTTGVWRLTA